MLTRPINPTLVKKVIDAAARRAGLDASLADGFSGHFMRVGAAQDLLRKGHDTAATMRAGGWKSVNIFARHLEHAEHNVWS